MVPGRRPDKRAFEHELFRFEFQVGCLARALRAGASNSRDYVQRAEIPLEIVSRIPSYGLRDAEAIDRILAELCAIVQSVPNNQFASTNAGSIAWALLRDRSDLPAGLKLVGFYFRAHDFGTCRLERADIRKCLLENVDLGAARIIKCSVADTQFITCSLTALTRWDGTILEIGQFHGVVMDGGERREIYAPTGIARVLREGGAILSSDHEIVEDSPIPADAASVALLERLLTHARTHFYISREESWFRNNLDGDPIWETVLEPLLRRHRLMEEVQLAKSGRPEKFLRLTVAPDKILQARAAGPGRSSPAAVQLWRELLHSVS